MTSRSNCSVEAAGAALLHERGRAGRERSGKVTVPHVNWEPGPRQRRKGEAGEGEEEGGDGRTRCQVVRS